MYNIEILQLNYTRPSEYKVLHDLRKTKIKKPRYYEKAIKIVEIFVCKQLFIYTLD